MFFLLIGIDPVRTVLGLLGHLFQELMQINHIRENKCVVVVCVCVCVSIIREEIMSLQPEISLGNLFILGEENKRELRKARGRAGTLLGHWQ